MVLKKGDLPVWIKRAVAAAFLVLVPWAFYGGHRLAHWAVKLQAVPAVIRSPWVFLPLFLAGTALIGRFFCETMCPLGTAQSLVNFVFHPKKSVRRVCTRLPETSAQRYVRWSIVLAAAVLVAAGCGGVAYSFEPYSIFGRSITLFGAYPLVFAAILLAAAVGSGRLWCNWVCPVGTVFAAVGRFAPFGNKVNRRCSNCRKCFPKPAPKKADAPSAPEEVAPKTGVERREVLKGVAVLAVAEKTTDGGLADLVVPRRAARRRSVLPPGALSRSFFSRACVACGLCTKACPQGVLAPSRSALSYGQPELDFTKSYCMTSCDRQCAKACPAGAIERLDGVLRRDMHVGAAAWNPERCLRSRDKIECTLCSRKCPVNAIHVVAGAIVVDDVACIGCGMCEHFCAARPEPAIVVEGLDNQRTVVPLKNSKAGEAEEKETK